MVLDRIIKFTVLKLLIFFIDDFHKLIEARLLLTLQNLFHFEQIFASQLLSLFFINFTKRPTNSLIFSIDNMISCPIVALFLPLAFCHRFDSRQLDCKCYRVSRDVPLCESDLVWSKHTWNWLIRQRWQIYGILHFAATLLVALAHFIL